MFHESRCECVRGLFIELLKPEITVLYLFELTLMRRNKHYYKDHKLVLLGDGISFFLNNTLT